MIVVTKPSHLNAHLEDTYFWKQNVLALIIDYNKT